MEDYYTIDEILVIYPHIKLSRRGIGELINLNLLIGYRLYGNTYIKRESWRELMAFRNNILEKQKSKIAL